MENKGARSRFRFGIRSVLILFVFLAIALSYGPLWYGWVRSTHLYESVAIFNSNHHKFLVSHNAPRLTTKEVIASIRKQLPTLDANESVKKALGCIANAELVPHNATFNTTTFSHRSGYAIDVDIMLTDETGYTFRVRDVP